ncbi:MAG: Rieske 2Fe-2S domain-containing protein [Chloroflexota bacterium]
MLASSELSNDRIVSQTIAGIPVAFYRDAEQHPTALLDICPHRGAKLSLGRVHENVVTCPFHGWQFDKSGTTVRVPWNPDARRQHLRATSFPVREIAGQVWIYTGIKAATEPSVHDVFLQPDVRLCGFSMEMDTHWTRVMENMLDWPHLPFVHQRSIGKDLVRKAENGRMDIKLEETSWGFSSRIWIDGEEQPGSLDYRFPNIMNLFIPIPSKTLVMQVACVPVTDTRTRLVMTTGRSFAKLGILDRFFNRENRKIAMEDRAVVESSYPVEVPRASDERSVRTDAPTLYFRQRYFSELRECDTHSTGSILGLPCPLRDSEDSEITKPLPGA